MILYDTKSWIAISLPSVIFIIFWICIPHESLEFSIEHNIQFRFLCEIMVGSVLIFLLLTGILQKASNDNIMSKRQSGDRSFPNFTRCWLDFKNYIMVAGVYFRILIRWRLHGRTVVGARVGPSPVEISARPINIYIRVKVQPGWKK